MDFRTLVRILGAHWKLSLIALLMCTFGAAFVTAVQTKHYQASATVFVWFSGATNLSDVYAGNSTALDRLSSYAQIAGGRAVAERAIGQLQIAMSPDDVVAHTKVKYAAKSLVFTVTVDDPSPARAAALAQAMAEQFGVIVGTLDSTPRPPGPHVTDAPQPPGDPLPGAVPPPDKPVLVAHARVVEPARVAPDPVSPVPARNMIIGFVAGVLLAVAVALTREATDHVVRTRAKAEEISGLPILAELPGKRGRAPKFGTDIAFDDAVRDLRARLTKAAGPDGRRIMLAAPFGGEGTTTTAINLARAYAEVGDTVLLVEGDTRSPVIAGALGVESGEGLAHALIRPDIAGEAVKGTSIAKLFTLAARSVRPNTPAVSAFLPQTIDGVLGELATRFDRVLVDGPPMLASSDTGMLGGAVQATVLVVRARRTTFDEVRDALAALREAHAQVVGVVLTDARPSAHRQASARFRRSKGKRAK